MRLIEVKEKVRISDEQERIQSSESDAREEEVLAWKHDVSFNELAVDYCIYFCYTITVSLDGLAFWYLFFTSTQA